MQATDFIKSAFPPRPADSHKYSVGTVTVVGGSARFIHAPVICGLGARAAGAGLIHLVVPLFSQCHLLVQALLPIFLLILRQMYEELTAAALDAVIYVWYDMVHDGTLI